MNVNLQTCGTSSLCVNESMNVGIMNIATNVQCCITDLCNNRTPAGKNSGENNVCLYFTVAKLLLEMLLE